MDEQDTMESIEIEEEDFFEEETMIEIAEESCVETEEVITEEETNSEEYSVGI